jgi:hypothetical protein
VFKSIKWFIKKPRASGAFCFCIFTFIAKILGVLKIFWIQPLLKIFDTLANRGHLLSLFLVKDFYLTQKALDGRFIVMADEERAIR